MSYAHQISIFEEARACLERACGCNPDTKDMLHDLNTIGRSETANDCLSGTIPAHADLLCDTISQIPDGPLSKLKLALTHAHHHLHWRVDDGEYYANGADVGEGYRTGNMHALLVGPQNSLFHANDFLLGFFLLAPRTLYRDHKHLAPEVYMPLTGPNGWRFGAGDWRDHDAGEIIYNAPNIVHATRVYDIPFLSLFAWTRNIAQPCSVVFAQDWDAVEAELQLPDKP
ncbi:hypothetical protein ROA7450_01027 [Roseovarius albus]|uniref:Uncharacterized protein n=1 Tax=Roseovarius albus TaxID=1247867 RepID=A0A1X6YMA6_9RHOB|nr:dimethylsulfonioproprionate lyase family protein [Roseovarius albus]SLN24982.1 hypothetical protein ROA7450_01027 [Roseovarius albus]